MGKGRGRPGTSGPPLADVGAGRFCPGQGAEAPALPAAHADGGAGPFCPGQGAAAPALEVPGTRGGPPRDGSGTAAPSSATDCLATLEERYRVRCLEVQGYLDELGDSIAEDPAAHAAMEAMIQEIEAMKARIRRMKRFGNKQKVPD